MLPEGSVFGGKRYASGDIFKLNVISTSSAVTNVINDSTYKFVYSTSSLGHNHLGHVDENIEKCKTCMLTEIIRSSFPNIH